MRLVSSNGGQFFRKAYRPPELPEDFMPDDGLAQFAFSHLYISAEMDAAGVFLLCPHCSGHRMQLEILQQPPKDNFYGIVNAICQDCQHNFTPLERILIGEKLPSPKRIRCRCKSYNFVFFHAKSGTNGFLEEEAIAGRCLECQKPTTVLKAD